MSNSVDKTADAPLVPLTDGELELELSEMEQITVRTLLEANGIQVVVQGASQMPNLPYELLVPENQLAEAVEILKAAQSGSGEPEQ